MRTTTIVAGGRDFNDIDKLKKSCGATFEFFDEVEIVSGMAAGADTLGLEYFKKLGYDITEFPADWEKYGRAAGPIRNREMLDYVKDKENPMLIAFWDAKSHGTYNMIKIAREAGIEVKIFNYKSL